MGNPVVSGLTRYLLFYIRPVICLACVQCESSEAMNSRQPNGER
jgi:hypothetical protein